MESFVVYLLKVTICLVVFSVFFRLLLMRETFFRLTRLTLISGLIICSVLPFVKLKLDKSYALQQTIYQWEETLLPEKAVENESRPDLQSSELITNANPESNIVQTQTVSLNRKEKTISWFSLLIAAYQVGVLMMLLRLGFSFTSLYRLFRKSRRVESGDCQLIVSPENIVPFSFFRYIVLSEKDYRENPNEVILHEKVHIQKKHNIDVFFSELFLAIHWFNPMVWLLCRDLREIHEYEADNAVINSGIEAQQYQLLLVKKAVGERRFTSVVNSFNQSKIKNRITMMLKKEAPKWARLKVLFALPLAAVALLAFAQPENVEDRLNDYVNRKNAMDYFLSVRKEQKDDYVAYLYMSANEQLFIMTEAIKDAVSIRVIDLKDKSDLPQIFSDLIAKKVNQITSTPVDFVLGAENDTKMKDVSTVKDAIRQAHNKWCGSVLNKRNIPLKVIIKDFPLSITYTSVQSNDPGDIVKQVQENPLFYWEQVQKFCNENGIEPKDIDLKKYDYRNFVFILINSVNAIMYTNKDGTKWFKTKEEALSSESVQELKKMIVETIEKNTDKPFYISLQNDMVSSTGFIIKFVNQVLPMAYEEALKDISNRRGVSFNEINESKPLLLLYAVPKNFSGKNDYASNSANQNRGEFQIRTSTKKDDMEEMAFLSGVRTREGEDRESVSLKWIAINGYNDDNVKNQKITFTDSVPIGSVDKALIIMDEKMGQSDVEGIKKMLSKEDKLAVKETYFVFGIKN